MRSRTYCFKRFRDDLKMLGFRHRRGHDLRRTMISLSREDGAQKDLLELCTHNPKKKGSSIDVYTTFPWEAFCAEIQKLVIRERPTTPRSLHRPAENLPAPTTERDWKIPMISGELATSFATSAVDSEGIQAVKSWRRRESSRSHALGNSSGVTKTCLRCVVFSQSSALASHTVSKRLDPTKSDPSDNRLTTRST
jgi:hypothetical protein